MARLEVRALSTVMRPATLHVAHPVAVPFGTFAPLPEPDAPRVVLMVSPVVESRLAVADTSLAGGTAGDGWQARALDWAHMAATRTYLGQGLVPGDGVLSPRGWLVDVKA